MKQTLNSTKSESVLSFPETMQVTDIAIDQLTGYYSIFYKLFVTFEIMISGVM